MNTKKKVMKPRVRTVTVRTSVRAGSGGFEGIRGSDRRIKRNIRPLRAS
jgi:hypothetical protein